MLTYILSTRKLCENTHTHECLTSLSEINIKELRKKIKHKNVKLIAMLIIFVSNHFCGVSNRRDGKLLGVPRNKNCTFI